MVPAIIHDHRPPAHLVVPGRVIQQLHQAIKGITIMNAQILPMGTDRNYAAAPGSRPALAQGVAPAGHGTSRYAKTVITVSDICTGCGRYYDLSTEADQVMQVAIEQGGIERVLVQCKDIDACYEQ